MKVMIALSGGVDSSVAASLLRQEGHVVIGGTLYLTQDPLQDASIVAEKLGLPFYGFHEETNFDNLIIQNFEDCYRRGETPNPCILCNKLIKFGLLLNHARNLDCDAVATGHYAVISQDQATGRYLLKRAKDPAKDQTYMLYLLSQEQLSRTLFPLGDFSKAQIRELALELGLSNAEKPDSQDICFVPDGDYAQFLENRCKAPYPSGHFVDETGHILGKHKGLIRYTVGQRKGLGIALGKPAFVLSKDAENNQIVLSTDEEKLFTRQIFADRLNWIPFDKPIDGLIVTAKTRYSQKEATCKLHLTENGVMAEFNDPQRAATPGQAMVFYDGDIVIGGGTITNG